MLKIRAGEGGGGEISSGFGDRGTTITRMCFHHWHAQGGGKEIIQGEP